MKLFKLWYWLKININNGESILIVYIHPRIVPLARALCLLRYRQPVTDSHVRTLGITNRQPAFFFFLIIISWWRIVANSFDSFLPFIFSSLKNGEFFLTWKLKVRPPRKKKNFKVRALICFIMYIFSKEIFNAPYGLYTKDYQKLNTVFPLETAHCFILTMSSWYSLICFLWNVLMRNAIFLF